MINMKNTTAIQIQTNFDVSPEGYQYLYQLHQFAQYQALHNYEVQMMPAKLNYKLKKMILSNNIGTINTFGTIEQDVLRRDFTLNALYYDPIQEQVIDYVGGMKETTLKEMLAKHPERVIEHAVKGMLPKGVLGSQMFEKLHVYAGPDHKHAAQKPETLEV